VADGAGHQGSRIDPLLGQRVATALVGAGVVVVGVFALPVSGIAALLGGVGALAAWEWSRLAGLVALGSRLAYVATIAVAAGAVFAVAGTAPSALVLWLALAWWCAVAVWLCAGGGPRPASASRRPGWLLAGVLLFPSLVAAGTVLVEPNPLGRWLLLYTICLVWVADIGAYFAGRAFGRNPLAPRVSAGKTREGVFGALLAVAAFAGICGLALGSSIAAWLGWIIVALVVALFSVVGDLFESVVKREAGAKDSGRLLPGHGGLLDRIDSLIAALPVAALGVTVLGLLEG